MSGGEEDERSPRGLTSGHRRGLGRHLGRMSSRGPKAWKDTACTWSVAAGRAIR
jgi:hypothetical protein